MIYKLPHIRQSTHTRDSSPTRQTKLPDSIQNTLYLLPVLRCLHIKRIYHTLDAAQNPSSTFSPHHLPLPHPAPPSLRDVCRFRKFVDRPSPLHPQPALDSLRPRQPFRFVDARTHLRLLLSFCVKRPPPFSTLPHSPSHPHTHIDGVCDTSILTVAWRCHDSPIQSDWG